MRNLKIPKRIRNHVNPLSDQVEHTFQGFSNTNPIIVDIGSYRGEFVASLVKKFNQEKNVIACEIRKPYANYLTELFTGTQNVRVFDGDSSRNLKNILSPSQKRGVSIEYIFINFPDPWFKDRHKKRRVITARFLQETKQWINPETIFVFQTDQKQLFLETQELLQEQGIVYKEFTESLWGIKTHWEMMKEEEGHAIYRMSFTF